MSFGLRIRFGRLCRLEKLRKEAFDQEDVIFEMENENYIYREYKEKYGFKSGDTDVYYKPFSFIDKRAIAGLIAEDVTHGL